jgi:ABC-type transport system involved in cytochrome bd biosynthesis fused ATPase/permease subunit
MTSDHAADIDRHVRVYITVFVALMVLTIITVAISRVHLPIAMAVTVALLVATVKGSLARSTLIPYSAGSDRRHRGEPHRSELIAEEGVPYGS